MHETVFRKIGTNNGSTYFTIPAAWKDIFHRGVQVRLRKHGGCIIVEVVE